MASRSVPGDEYFPDYDLKDVNGTTYEVKTDFKWKDTGNVAIEQTALQHSKADYFVYKLNGGKGLYLLPRYMVEQLYRTNRVVRGGDQYHPMALVPLRTFLRHSSKLTLDQPPTLTNYDVTNERSGDAP